MCSSYPVSPDLWTQGFSSVRLVLVPSLLTCGPRVTYCRSSSCPVFPTLRTQGFRSVRQLPDPVSLFEVGGHVETFIPDYFRRRKTRRNGDTEGRGGVEDKRRLIGSYNILLFTSIPTGILYRNR